MVKISSTSTDHDKRTCKISNWLVENCRRSCAHNVHVPTEYTFIVFKPPKMVRFKSKKKVSKIKYNLSIMQKSHEYLQTMTKELAKFQIDRYTYVWGAAHTKYQTSNVKCLRKKKQRVNPQGEPRWKKKKKKRNTVPLIFHVDAIYKISGS